jgi:hypothetical protein
MGEQVMEKFKIIDADSHIEEVMILRDHRRAGYGEI